MPDYDADFTSFAQSGCADAFRRLVARHVDAVHSAARRLLDGRADAAADVAQAVFIQLASKATTLPADLIVGSWLHRQTVRLALNARRADARRLVRERTAHEMHAISSHVADPRAAEMLPLIDQAICALPTLDQRVLVMHYFDNCQQREIAERLGVSAGAVQKRLTRALERVRRHLERRGAAVTAVALAAWFSGRSVQAAPASLAASIATQALPHAAAGSGFLTTLITAMTHTKALTAGALASLLACGVYYQQVEKIASARVLAGPPSSFNYTARNVVATSPGTRAQELPSTFPEIVVALESLTNGPDTRLARQRITTLLRRIAPEDYLAFFITGEARIHPLRWRDMIEDCVELWSQTDPAMLTAAMFESDNRKQDLLRKSLQSGSFALNCLQQNASRKGGGNACWFRLGEAFEAWLKVDANAALTWWESKSGEPLMKRFNGGMEVSISEAMPDLPLATLPIAGLSPITQRSLKWRWAQNVIGERTSLTEVLNSRSFSAEEVRELARYLGSRQEVNDSMQTLADMPDRKQAYAAALGLLSNFSPADKTVPGRLDWARIALSLADNRPREEALRDIVTAWMEVHEGDSPNILGWVQESGGSEASMALAAGARELASRPEPEMAESLSWVDAIPNAAQRRHLLRGIFLRWHDADPNAASQYLKDATPAFAAELHSIMEES